MTKIRTITDLRKRNDELVTDSCKKNGRIYQLEREVERLTTALQNTSNTVDSRSREEGRLDGYRQRVREEDAKSLGKLWHEAFERDAYGNPVFR